MANTIGFDPVAWSIDGGRHNGELMRVLAYASTAGSEGIVSTADCRTHQLTTPGGQVAVDAGALLIRNRSANVRNQTYVANGRVETRLDIRPTGAAGREDLIVVRIEDPQYAPWPAVDPAEAPTFQYVRPVVIEGVPGGTSSFTALNLGQSGYAVARVVIPPNTSVITDSMIRDLRKVAQPRRERRVALWSPDAATPPVVFGPISGATSPWQWLPRLNELIDCPPWATQVKMIVSVGNLLHIGDLAGQIRGEYGWNGQGQLVTDPAGLHHADTTVGARTRMHVTTASEMAVPAAMRGKSHFVRTGTILHPATGRLEVDQWVNVVVDLEFVEVPE